MTKIALINPNYIIKLKKKKKKLPGAKMVAAEGTIDSFLFGSAFKANRFRDKFNPTGAGKLQSDG